MPKKAVTFREIFTLLTAREAQKYLIKNWTQNVYEVKRSEHFNGAPHKVGYKEDVPLGGSLILEKLLDINRSTQNRIVEFYDGKRSKLPEPQSPFFRNLSQLLIALDDQGTPLTRPGDKTPIVFRGETWNGLWIAPWMQLWLLYNQDAPKQEDLLSPFMAAHARNSTPIEWDNPPTVLASRLFALMKKLNRLNADDLATTLFGGNSAHENQPGLADVIRKVIDGEPLTASMDANSALSMLAIALVPELERDKQFGVKQLIQESVERLSLPAANPKGRAIEK
jgi:hypothetical protein